MLCAYICVYIYIYHCVLRGHVYVLDSPSSSASMSKKRTSKRFFIIVDQKAVPFNARTSVAAFGVLFKAHYVFNISYDEALSSFYTLIQTTVYNIDVLWWPFPCMLYRGAKQWTCSDWSWRTDILYVRPFDKQYSNESDRAYIVP